jgi:hypothetical protein
MSEVSNCGLGQTAATALLDILKHFREEVEAHIVARVCPLGICSMGGPVGAPQSVPAAEPLEVELTPA